MTQINVLGICGSLRKKSYNKMLLNIMMGLASENMKIKTFDRLSEIPLYNEDVEKQAIPEVVQDLNNQIKNADVLLITTPEYNYSVPGVLKNAIDWASRPPSTSSLKNKLCGIVGASQGAGGTIRSQLALRQIFLFTSTEVMMKPEIYIAKAQDKFSEDGELKDEKTKKFLSEYMQEFEKWINQRRGEV